MGKYPTTKGTFPLYIELTHQSVCLLLDKGPVKTAMAATTAHALEELLDAICASQYCC
jgi:hypothetical protein